MVCGQDLKGVSHHQAARLREITPADADGLRNPFPGSRDET
jgi:hypothetical protein